MDVCDVLVKLDDEILSDESKWCKGELVNVHGQMCLIGGITKAVYGEARRGHPTLRVPDVGKDHIYQDVMEVVYRETPNRTTISYFNDADETTFEDVKALIRKVRQKVCV